MKRTIKIFERKRNQAMKDLQSYYVWIAVFLKDVKKTRDTLADADKNLKTLGAEPKQLKDKNVYKFADDIEGLYESVHSQLKDLYYRNLKLQSSKKQ